MKSSKQALFVVIVLCLVIITLSACAGETPEVSYENLDAAIADGAIERGWIPEWLPLSAYDIQEKHNLDSNAQILRFAVKSWEEEDIPDQCQPAQDGQPPSLNAQWWPGNIAKEAQNLYTCGSNMLAIIDTQAYYWRP